MVQPLVFALVTLQALANVSVPIRLAVESRADKDRGVLLAVTISNLAASPVQVRGIGVITLREKRGNFWAPFGLATSGPMERGAQSVLELSAGERRTITIALAELHWGRSSAALWPFQALELVVPTATYDATVNITGGAGVDTESNTVKVHVRGAAGP